MTIDNTDLVKRLEWVREQYGVADGLPDAEIDRGEQAVTEAITYITQQSQGRDEVLEERRKLAEWVFEIANAAEDFSEPASYKEATSWRIRKAVEYAQSVKSPSPAHEERHREVEVYDRRRHPVSMGGFASNRRKVIRRSEVEDRRKSALGNGERSCTSGVVFSRGDDGTSCYGRRSADRARWTGGQTVEECLKTAEATSQHYIDSNDQSLPTAQPEPQGLALDLLRMYSGVMPDDNKATVGMLMDALTLIDRRLAAITGGK